MKLERATAIALAAAIITYASVLFAVVAYAAGTPMQQARESVARLASADPLYMGGCSVVIISPNVVISAKHCMDIPQMVVQRQGGPAHPVVAFNTHNTKDLAVLTVPMIGCPCARTTDVRAEMDELAYAVGFPYGIGNVLTVGHIQGRVFTPDGQEYLLATPNVNPGVSGGGLFVVRGDMVFLVGILVMMTPEGSPLLAVELVP
jgi:S1-C subfamily serine protease